MQPPPPSDTSEAASGTQPPCMQHAAHCSNGAPTPVNAPSPVGNVLGCAAPHTRMRNCCDQDMLDMKDAEAFARHSHTTSGRYVCCCAEQGRTGQHSTAQLGGVKLVMMVPAGCSWPAALPQHPPHPVYCMYASIRLCSLHCTVRYLTALSCTARTASYSTVLQGRHWCVPLASL